MDVILKQDVEKLGLQDDMVSVKGGYGRNFLIPQGHAELATPSKKKMHAEMLKQRAHKEAKMKEEAIKHVAALKKMVVKVGAKVGENGKIFGSVNNLQVTDALKALGYDVDRKNVKIQGDAIKQIGTYQAEVRFHRDVIETIPFEVVGE